MCPCTEADCKNAGADRKVFELEELQEELEDGADVADKCRRCKTKRPLRWLLPEGALGDAYLPADAAMQRLEEHVPPPDDPAHTLTALAGSNFEREYAALRPSLLRVGDRVSVGGESAAVSHVRTGHRYDVRIDSPQQVLLDVNGDDLDFSELDLTTRAVQAIPAYRDELLWALRRVIKGHCEWHGKPEAECNAFLQKLYGQWKLEDSVALAAQRLWTSAKKLGGVDNGNGHGVDVGAGAEFCSMWTEVIRRDQASLARPSAIIARALNRQLVGAPSNDRDGVDGSADFPKAKHSSDPRLKFCTWRGGGFGVAGVPDSASVSSASLRAFFTPGKEYRVNQFLATSFSVDKADHFVRKSHRADAGRELVKWRVALDPRGEEMHSPGDEDYQSCRKFRCKHVQYLAETHVQGEEEYLFSAFSVFTVSAEHPPVWSATPTDPATPHAITVLPALDNKIQPDGQPWPDDLPLAPWC